MTALAKAQDRMRSAGVSERAINVFSDLYDQLCHGATGLIAESDIAPLGELDHVSEVDVSLEEQRAAAAGTAVIKLNGGLGTTMGMDRAKSLLPVRPDLTFLDVIVGQVQTVRERLGVDLPLLFMNSFRTREDTLEHLKRYPDLAVEGLPVDFLQSKEPRLLADDLTPVSWDDDPDLEWCPPGHGDLYTAIATSGVLDALLERGITRAFISNADNLGATPDPVMMAWFAHSGAPFAAEVCRRTPADVKGGHPVVRRADGRIVLRETAQIHPDDVDAARDLTVHRYFNTNSLWIDLVSLRENLDAHDGVLGLPLIRNVKNVVPTDSQTPEVIQLETAMGAAIEVFDGATAIEVDRARFLPVKSTNDLALLRSDVYEVCDDFTVGATIDDIPLVDLDPRYFKVIHDFERRLEHVPSLAEATSLTVRGDWTFGPGVVVRGEAELPDEGEAMVVEAGSILGSDRRSG